MFHWLPWDHHQRRRLVNNVEKRDRVVSAEVAAILRSRRGIRLDIGCGGAKQPGFVGIDRRALPGVDIVWDVERFPWPLPDECVVVAFASHLLEHIKPWLTIDFMDEVWRVLQVDAQFAIAVPYWTSPGYAQDPTHCNQMNEHTWAYFDPEAYGGQLYNIYQPKPWKIESVTFDPMANMEVLLRKRRGA